MVGCLINHPTNTITMVVALLLQRHGCGESVTRTPGSLFKRARVRAVFEIFV
jgi:hypothetical protein